MTGMEGISGGIATANRNLLASLTKFTTEKQHALSVLSYLEKPADRPAGLPDSIPFQAFAGRKTRLVAALWKAAAARSVMLFDHVTLALPVLPFSATGMTRTIIVAHGSESWRHIRRSSRWVFRFAALTLTNSEFTLKKMRKRHVRGNLTACPLGLAPQVPLNPRLPESLALPIPLTAADGSNQTLGNRTLLLVGRMHPQEREKGHDELLAVWPAIRSEYSDAQLVFAGPGDDRLRLSNLAVEKGVGRSVFLPGRVPIELLQQLYHRSYAFVMPSRQEGFGLAYLEAMNWGKACLGCFDDGAEDVIMPGETGLLIHNPKNGIELIGALRQMLVDPAATQRMGQRGFERLHACYTAEHAQRRICEQLMRVL